MQSTGRRCEQSQGRSASVQSSTGLLIQGRQGSMKDMPKLPQPIIEVAWRHSAEQGKIHYRAKRPDGSNRHLVAREGEALYDLLESHLQAIGYTGPKSAAEESVEH